MTAPDTKAIRAQMEALTGFTVGPWYAHNLPGDWGLRGAYSIHVACANPHEWDPCIAQVEYQTPYCLGKKAARTAACNARLIAAAPDMHATILALCDALDTEQSKVRRMGRADRPRRPRAERGRRQMKVLIVGGPNRGQVVDVEATPSNMLELVQVRDPVRGEAYWFKVEADVQDKHGYVMGELCRAYEFVTRGETRRQHVGENGKL